MKKLLFFAIPLIIFSCGQQSDKALTEEQKTKIIEEIKPLVSQLWESNAQLNYEKWIELYGNSKDFVFMANGQMFSYNDLAGFKEIWKLLEYQKYSPVIEKFNVLNQDAVIYSMQGNASAKYKTGDIMNTDKYAITLLFKKVDGQWKIINGHASYPLPGTASTTSTQGQK